MNKILVDEEIYVLNNGISVLDINKDTKIYINNLDDIDVTFNIKDNINVVVYDFNLKNKNSNIVVNQECNSNFSYYHTFKINGDYKFNYVSNMNGDNNKNELKISGISNGNANINVDGIVKGKTKNNYLDEDIKVLTIDGKANISPMMHINIKEVIANHNTAISNVREDVIFYLMSKGISRDEAIRLICDGYLYGLFNNEEEFLKAIK